MINLHLHFCRPVLAGLLGLVLVSLAGAQTPSDRGPSREGFYREITAALRVEGRPTEADFTRLSSLLLRNGRESPDDPRLDLNAQLCFAFNRRQRDPEAHAAWDAHLRAALVQELATADLTPRVRDIWEGLIIRIDARKLEETRRAGGAIDLAPLRARIDALIARSPEGTPVLVGETLYHALLSAEQPAAVEAYLLHTVASPNAAVVEFAQGELNKIASTRQPLELTFTAMDGREIDLADFRGQVVLIDFWATWCVPCIKELPKLKAVYAKYRDHGLVVIGVSFDKANAEAKLRAFIEENDLDWIHHYDGRGWQNEIGQRFAIRAVPTVFLLNREGVVVDTNARGDRLDGLVREQLGL
jgi:thiol-disulfide isomerase/thioredoxin